MRHPSQSIHTLCLKLFLGFNKIPCYSTLKSILQYKEEKEKLLKDWQMQLKISDMQQSLSLAKENCSNMFEKHKRKTLEILKKNEKNVTH